MGKPVNLGVEWVSDIADFEVYEELKASEKMSFQRGQFFLGPIKYPCPPPSKVLEVAHYEPLAEENTKFRIGNYSAKESKQQIPIKSLNLSSQDRLYVVQGKARPVIILSYCMADWLCGSANKAEAEELLLCLPIFTFKTRHTQAHIINIQTFLFPNLFYIPPSPSGVLKESAARFELIQPVHKEDLIPLKNISARPFKLSDDILKILWNHLTLFLASHPLSMELQGELEAYRALIMEKMEGQES